MSWKKNIGFLERTPDMVPGLRHHALSVNRGKIRRLLNAREYFADCFAFWVVNGGNQQRMEQFRNAAPQTWAYLERLAANGWRV